MNLDFQAMDWGTMIQRITNKGPVDKGGWSLFHTAGSNVSMASPALNFFIRGDGGWTPDPQWSLTVADAMDAILARGLRP